MTRLSKKQKSRLFEIRKPVLILLSVAVLISALIITWANYSVSKNSKSIDAYQTQSRVPYVDGKDATAHVTNFYSQYINPRTSSSFRQILIKGYGNSNLLFYSQYYRHGFDPITCSAEMPSRVLASLVSTGPVATIRAVAEKSDGTQEVITVKVVLDDEGLSIDAINCSGAKGNLPPNET